MLLDIEKILKTIKKNNFPEFKKKFLNMNNISKNDYENIFITISESEFPVKQYLEFLKSKNADFSINQTRFLREAASFNNFEIVSFLLEENCNVNDGDGIALVAATICNAKEEMINLLLSHGADINLALNHKLTNKSAFRKLSQLKSKIEKENLLIQNTNTKMKKQMVL